MSFFAKTRIILLSLAAYIVYSLLRRTYRFTVLGLDPDRLAQIQQRPFILAFWHNQQVSMPYIWTDNLRRRDGSSKAYVMISQHGDGRIVAGAIRLLGLRSIDGSSSRGGKEALHRCVDLLLKEKSDVIMTPDGPRGPVYQSKPGVVRIAQLSGAPITPCALVAEKKWTFRSWDKMFLPKPFSRVVIAVGESILVTSDLSEDEFLAAQKAVDQSLNALTEQCEQSLRK